MRSEQMLIKLSKDEKAMLHAIAEELNLTASELIRQRTFKTSPKAPSRKRRTTRARKSTRAQVIRERLKTVM